MTKLVKVFLGIAVFCVFGAASFWLSAGLSQRAQATSDTVPRVTPIERVNEKARKARSGEEAAVSDLTDAVFNTIVGESDVIGNSIGDLKERVVRSEMEYREGKKKGVKEEDVARVVNGLAKKYGAPDYAKTNKREVRELRVSMLKAESDFIARGKNDGKGKPKKKKGDTIEPEMSPLEAVYVTADMMKQKLYNEDYQMTQEERRARWTELHTKKRDCGECEGKVLDSPRYKEMQEVSRRAVKKGASDALETAHQTLDILGIDR